MIELRNVSKIYKLGKTDVVGLKNVNLPITKGDFIALAGPSGSGKTTFLNILGCLDTPTSGEVLFENESLNDLSAKRTTIIRRDKIGFIFQNFNLVPVLSVYENVEYPLLLTNMKKSQRKELVNSVLEEVGLSHRAKHSPSELSGGERQRVSIARALVKKPSIILADEPTANLDSDTGLHIVELMEKLNEVEKVTIVFSSHDEKILKSVKRVIHIRDGVLSA